MNNIKIKLIDKNSNYMETSVYNLDTTTKELKFISLNGTSSNFGNYTTDDANSEFIPEGDNELIKFFLDNCGQELVSLALDNNLVIGLRKELWFYDEFAIVESWLEKDSLVMKKQNTKALFYKAKEAINA